MLKKEKLYFQNTIYISIYEVYLIESYKIVITIFFIKIIENLLSYQF